MSGKYYYAVRRGRPAIEEVHCAGCGELAEAAFSARFTRSGTRSSPRDCGTPTALSASAAPPCSAETRPGMVLK